MARIFILSIIFFIVQAVVVIQSAPQLYESFLDLDIKYLTFEKRQKAAITHIQQLRKNNKNKSKTIYVLGGSSGREYFKPEEETKDLVPMPLVNICTASQNLLDSIRLIDNINVPGSVVILTFPPFKFMTHSNKMLSSTKYLTGTNLKYPIESRTLDSLLKDVKPANITITLMPSLNALIYLSKSYINHKKDHLLSGLASIWNGTSNPKTFKNMFVDPLPIPRYLYVDAESADRQKLRKGLQKMRDTGIKGKLSGNLETNLGYLKLLADLAKEKDVKLILYELPYSQTGESIFRSELKIYRKAMNSFLEQHPDIPFFKVEYNLYNGKEELFHDHVHLTGAGREYYHPHVINTFKQVFSNGH